MNKLFLAISLLLVITPVMGAGSLKAMVHENTLMNQSRIMAQVNSTITQVMNQSQLRSKVNEAVKSLNHTQLRINQTTVMINAKEVVVNATRELNQLRISNEEMVVNGLELFNDSPIRTKVQAVVSTRSGDKSINLIRDNNSVKLVDESNVSVQLSLNQRVRLEDGQLILNQSGVDKVLSVLPSQAMNQLKATNKTVKSIELAVEQNRTVYKVKEEKQVKLFGLIPVNLSVESSVDAVNGEIVNVNKPWWSFLTI